VTIDAPHRMNVVRTLAVGECRVHLCHIELAVRDGRMTILAALFRIVAMVVVACQAADPFMNTSRRPIVAGSRLMECTGSVALKTNALKEIVPNPRPSGYRPILSEKASRQLQRDFFRIGNRKVLSEGQPFSHKISSSDRKGLQELREPLRGGLCDRSSMGSPAELISPDR